MRTQGLGEAVGVELVRRKGGGGRAMNDYTYIVNAYPIELDMRHHRHV
jgi:hypothetical protein